MDIPLDSEHHALDACDIEQNEMDGQDGYPARFGTSCRICLRHITTFTQKEMDCQDAQVPVTDLTPPRRSNARS